MNYKFYNARSVDVLDQLKNTVYKHSIWRGEKMENLTKQELTLSRIQLIADISQTAQCNPQEFLVVMSLISELASQALTEAHHDALSYNGSTDDAHRSPDMTGGVSQRTRRLPFPAQAGLSAPPFPLFSPFLLCQ